MIRFFKTGLRFIVMGVFIPLAAAPAADDGSVLLRDDFDQPGPINAQKWEVVTGEPAACNNGSVINAPNKIWNSKIKFVEPVAVEFSGVFIAQLPQSSNNQFGLAPSGHGPDMVVWAFDGTEPKRLVPLRHVGGTDFWKEGYEKAVELSKLPDITKTENAINLRIDWWSGKIVRYYLNDKMVAEFTENVPSVAVPVGVRDETVGFRINGIKVTRITQSADEILREKARSKEEAERAAAQASEAAEKAKAQAKAAETRTKDEAMLARINARVAAIAKQFPKLRMVIGGPCYMWGIDAQIESDLKSAGMDVLCWPNAPLLGRELNAQMGRSPTEYNIIIFGDSFYHLVQPDPNTGEIPKRIKDQIPLLRKFLEAGGGIWFCGLGEQNWGKSSVALNYILKELNLGAEVVAEVVRDSVSVEIGRRYPFFGGYAWTEVMPDPLTEGVKGLWHPSGIVAGEGSMGVVPITRLSPEWRVLVKGSSTAASFGLDSSASQIGDKLLNTPGAVKSNPILGAVRQVGKGRVVLWPTWSNFTVTGGSGGMLVDGEKDGRISDGARLIENLLCWLAEPGQGTQNVGTFDPEKYHQVESQIDVEKELGAWAYRAQPGWRDYNAQYKGLIGAHSILSDGKSSPEEMISAAKKAGYQFIAFTEDFAKMNEQKWNQLLSICDKTNAADSRFIAYSGLNFTDEAGNRGVIFGNRFWIKDAWRSKEYPDRIRWWYNLTYEADADAHRWSPRVIVCSKTNNKRPWNQGLWSFLGAYCYEGGKIRDDSMDEWRRLIGKHVYFLNTSIMAIHTVRSTEEISASSQPGLYQTYVRADNLQQVLNRLIGCVSPGPGAYFSSYVSAGPEILDFRLQAVWPAGEGIDAAIPGNDRGVLHILVRAGAGLKEVAVYDGERLVRKYMPGAEAFETILTFHPDSYHAYSMTITDQQGHQAVSWPAWMQIQENVHRRCGDNWNWMKTGKGPGTAKPIDFSYQLHETTAGWTSRKFIPDRERKEKAKLPSYQSEQGNYSHGGLSAAINGYIHSQGLLVEAKSWPSTYPAMTLDFATVGRFGTILTNTVREEMLVPKLEPATSGCFAGPYRIIPSPWPADLTQYVPMQKPDGARLNRYRGKVTFEKEVHTPDGKPLNLDIGVTGDPGANIVEVLSPGGTSKKVTVGDETVSGKIPIGGYLCWYDDKGKGVGGIISLSPGVQYTYTKRLQRCSISVPSPVKPGTEVTWDVIFVTGNDSSINSNSQMEDVRLGMGIAGKPTLYKVQPRLGRVVDQKYFLTLKSENGGFSGKVVKTSNKLLPIHLPVFVNGLNPRWDAAIWYRGKSYLHTPRYYKDPWGVETWRWVIATYEPRVDEVRYIPVLDGGTGYCQIDTDQQDPDVFIGNLLVCNHLEVFISVIEAEKGRCIFEVNNPTDRELTCTIRPSNGFELTGKWKKEITLSAGAVQKVDTGIP